MREIFTLLHEECNGTVVLQKAAQRGNDSERSAFYLRIGGSCKCGMGKVRALDGNPNERFLQFKEEQRQQGRN
jgi:hypothetical protein